MEYSCSNKISFLCKGRLGGFHLKKCLRNKIIDAHGPEGGSPYMRHSLKLTVHFLTNNKAKEVVLQGSSHPST